MAAAGSGVAAGAEPPRPPCAEASQGGAPPRTARGGADKKKPTAPPPRRLTLTRFTSRGSPVAHRLSYCSEYDRPAEPTEAGASPPTGVAEPSLKTREVASAGGAMAVG